MANVKCRYTEPEFFFPFRFQFQSNNHAISVVPDFHSIILRKRKGYTLARTEYITVITR